MAQFYYVIDTGISTTTDGVTTFPGQNVLTLLGQEKFKHGIVPVGATIGLWEQIDGVNRAPDDGATGITTNRSVRINNDLTVNRNLNVIGITTSETYDVGGVQSVSLASGTQVVNAATTQMLYLAGNYNTNTNTQTITFQVSNLESGRSVDLYVRNTATCAYTIALQASTSSSGFTAVRFSNAGDTDLASFTLVAPGGGGPTGAAHIWVANIGGQLVASLS